MACGEDMVAKSNQAANHFRRNYGPMLQMSRLALNAPKGFLTPNDLAIIVLRSTKLLGTHRRCAAGLGWALRRLRPPLVSDP